MNQQCGLILTYNGWYSMFNALAGINTGLSWKCHLFTAASREPCISSLVGDFTEAAWTSYASQVVDVTWSPPFKNKQGCYVLSVTPFNFLYDGSSGTIAVVGAYFTDTDNSNLLTAVLVDGEIDGPVPYKNLIASGDFYPINFKFSMPCCNCGCSPCEC